MKGYSQEYMAYRLGISQQSYSRLESGRQDMRIRQLEDIARVLEIYPTELMRDEQEPAVVTHEVMSLLSRLEKAMKHFS